MIKLVQIIPIDGVRLFGRMVKKEVELSRQNRGTFHRSASKVRDHAKWSHAKFNGWINLERTESEIVVAEVQSRSQSDDTWQIFQAFVGWIDRHFGDEIEAVHIHYRR
jgi:hypothetical protein